jgi:hypothetical protein
MYAIHTFQQNLTLGSSLGILNDLCPANRGSVQRHYGCGHAIAPLKIFLVVQIDTRVSLNIA